MPARLLLLPSLLAALVVLAVPAWAESVPDVTGLTQAEAESLLQQAGFVAQVRYDATRPDGLVFAQEPPGFAARPRGTTVVLRVGGRSATPGVPDSAPVPSRPDLPVPPGNLPPSSFPPPGGTPPGSPPTAVPSVTPTPGLIGLPLDEARRQAGALPLRFERTLSVPELSDHIVDQWPTEAEPLQAGQTLTLVVGVAEMPSDRHAVVPDVTGLERAGAEAVLREAGFGARPLTTATRGRVLVHFPLPGSLAITGSFVELDLDGSAASGAPQLPTPPAVPSGTNPATPPVLPLPAPRAAPDTRSPAEGDTYPEGMPVLFDWSSVPGADAYDWQLLREDDAGRPMQVERERAGSPPLQRLALPRGRYLWRVRALSSGGAGPWSTTRSLYIY